MLPPFGAAAKLLAAKRNGLECGEIDPTLASPSTAVVVTNYVFQYVTNALIGSQYRCAVQELQTYLKTINPNVGDKEGLRYLPILNAIRILSWKQRFPGSEKLLYALEYMDFYTNATNSLMFPGEYVNWEGISSYLTFTAQLAVEAIKDDPRRNRESMVVNFCLHYMAKPRNSRGRKPDVHSWIDSNGSWKGITSFLSKIGRGLGGLTLASTCPSNPQCICQAVMKVDNRDCYYPFQCCVECGYYWCNIQKCCGRFPSMLQLVAHHRSVHGYHETTVHTCSKCTTIFPLYDDFSKSFQKCVCCSSFLCLVNQCQKIFDSSSEVLCHQRKDHPDCYTCQKCGVAPKTRDGEQETGLCRICGDNYWCL